MVMIYNLNFEYSGEMGVNEGNNTCDSWNVRHR